MDGRMDGKVVGRVVGRYMGGWWEGGLEDGGRGGGCCRAPLELQRGSQGPACVASEKSGLFSSCEGPVGIPLKSLPT